MPAAGRGEVVDDGETESRAVVLGVGGAPEPIEGVRKLLRRQSLAAIQHVHLSPALVLADHDLDRRTARTRDPAGNLVYLGSVS